MKFVFLQATLGLILSIFGIQTIYIYVQGLDSGASSLLLLLALILIGVGVFLLMRAGKSDALVIKRLKNFGQKKQPEASLEQVLEKNNELSNSWAKTVEKRDKLKMLEISAAAQNDTAE